MFQLRQYDNAVRLLEDLYGNIEPLDEYVGAVWCGAVWCGVVCCI